jgi:hypothetical protein
VGIFLKTEDREEGVILHVQLRYIQVNMVQMYVKVTQQVLRLCAQPPFKIQPWQCDNWPRFSRLSGSCCYFPLSLNIFCCQLKDKYFISSKCIGDCLKMSLMEIVTKQFCPLYGVYEQHCDRNNGNFGWNKAVLFPMITHPCTQLSPSKNLLKRKKKNVLCGFRSTAI